MSPLGRPRHCSSPREFKTLVTSRRGGRHLRQESLAHQIHAPHVGVHGEVPVVLLTVQNGAVVHEAGDDREQRRSGSLVQTCGRRSLMGKL